MSEHKESSAQRIAILGWGSLIWDARLEFSMHHEEWQPNGPLLPLEFSRISESRKGALTLVVDPQYGTICRTAYAVSTRRDPTDVIVDLRIREGTGLKWIGFYFANGSRKGEIKVPETIVTWAAAGHFDVVVWTGLPNNFKDKNMENFSVEAAIRHIENLSHEGKSMATEYVRRTPDFVQTPLRTALQSLPWFPSPAKDPADP